MSYFAAFKRVFSNIASTTWNGIKTIVAPIIIPAGRAVTYSGQSLFYLLNFIKLVTNRLNHPAGYYSGIVAIACSLVVIIPTRGVAVWRYFRNSDAKSRPESHTQAEPMVLDSDDIELGKIGKGLYRLLSALSYDTVLFTLLNSYLNAMTLIEFIAMALKTDPHDKNHEYYTQAGALGLAACTMVTYYIYSIKKAIPNARLTAHHVEHLSFPMNKYSAVTLLIGLLGTPAIPFTNCFTTINALEKIPGVKSWDYRVKFAVGSVSAVSFTVAHVLTQLPAIYEALASGKQKMRYTSAARWEKSLAIAVYTAATGEMIVFGLGNYNGIVKTSVDAFGIDKNNVVLMTTAIPLASSTAILNFFFSGHQGLQKTLLQYHKDRGEIAYDNGTDIENVPVQALPRPEESGSSVPAEKTFRRSGLPVLFANRTGSGELSGAAETTPLIIQQPAHSYSSTGTSK